MLTKVFKKWSLFSKKNNNIKNIIFYNINKKPYANLSPRVHNLSFTSILTHIKGKNVPKQTQDVCLLHTRIKEKSYSYDNRVPSNIICCSNSAKDVHTTLSAQSTVLRNPNVTGFYLCIIRLHH